MTEEERALRALALMGERCPVCGNKELIPDDSVTMGQILSTSYALCKYCGVVHGKADIRIGSALWNSYMKLKGV